MSSGAFVFSLWETVIQGRIADGDQKKGIDIVARSFS